MIAVLFILLSPFAFIVAGIFVLEFGVDWFVRYRESAVLGRMLDEARRQREVDRRRYQVGDFR